jgi:hypothetical protein
MLVNDSGQRWPHPPRAGFRRVDGRLMMAQLKASSVLAANRNWRVFLCPGVVRAAGVWQNS